MKAVLEILPVGIDPQKCIFVCEISNEGFSYAIKDDDDNTYVAVAAFHFDKNTGPADASIILKNKLQDQRLLSGSFKKAYIMYSFGESVLIPFSLYNSRENNHVLNLVHGDIESNASILTDVIVESGIYNSYRVPTPVLDVIRSKFPGAVNWHQYSVLLKQVLAKDDKLVIIFYPKKLVLMLNKNGGVRFINTFYYNTTDDVLYILLNTCKQFEIENIPVEINGMAEVNSLLSKEIHKHFSPVSFTQLPSGVNYSEEILRHPSHYFSYIFAADSCE